MKKLISTILAIAIATTFTMAQSNAEQIAKRRLATMDEQLDLSAEQEAKILVAQVVQAEEQIENKKLQGEPEYQVAAKTTYKKFYSVLKETLTEEQLAKWREFVTNNNKKK